MTRCNDVPHGFFPTLLLATPKPVAGDSKGTLRWFGSLEWLFSKEVLCFDVRGLYALSQLPKRLPTFGG